MFTNCLVQDLTSSGVTHALMRTSIRVLFWTRQLQTSDAHLLYSYIPVSPQFLP